MAQISDQAAQTSLILVGSLRDGRKIRELHSEVIHSVADLVKTVAQLNNSTRMELEKINGSAYLIQQRLQMPQLSIWSWNKWIIKALEIIYCGNA